MKTNLIKAIYLTFGLSALALTGCSDSWLKPEPLSFYEPSVTLSTKEGLEAALTTCHRQMRYYYMGYGNDILGCGCNGCIRL